MTTFLFDLDNTLYDQKKPFFDAYCEFFGDRFNLDLSKLYYSSRKYSDKVFEMTQNGKMKMEDMYIYRLKNAFKDFDIDIADKEALDFQKYYSKNQKILEMTPLMKKIIIEISEKFPVGVISNGPTEHQLNKAKALNLLNWIPREHIFISEEYQSSKPDRKIFDIALNKLNANPNDSYFIGDTFENDIIGAKNANIKTIWFNRDNQKTPTNKIKSDYIVYNEEELYNLLNNFFD